MKHFLPLLTCILFLFACASPDADPDPDADIPMIDFHLFRIDSLEVIPYDDQKDTSGYFAVYKSDAGETTSAMWYKGEDIPTIISKPAYIFIAE